MIPVHLGIAFGAEPWLGADALWLSYPAAMTAAMAMAILLFRRGGWREGHLLPMGHHACRRHAGAGHEPLGTVNAAV